MISAFFKSLSISLGLLCGVGIFSAIFFFTVGSWFLATPVSDGLCNIAIIPIHGEIFPFSNVSTDEFGNVLYDSNTPEAIRAALTRITDDTDIKGILLNIDSPGGSPAGSEAITKMIQKSTLPVVALTGDLADSGGYMIATGADTIIASPFSDIGSIGVTMSYLDSTKKNEQDGLTYVELSSVPHKNYLSPNRPLSDEERTRVLDDLKIYHDAFVDMIATNRNIPRERMGELADGFSMPASKAVQNGLVDSIGDVDSARAWFAEKLQMNVEDVVICEEEII